MSRSFNGIQSLNSLVSQAYTLPEFVSETISSTEPLRLDEFMISQYGVAKLSAIRSQDLVSVSTS